MESSGQALGKFLNAKFKHFFRYQVDKMKQYQIICNELIARLYTGLAVRRHSAPSAEETKSSASEIHSERNIEKPTSSASIAGEHCLVPNEALYAVPW